MSGKIRPQTPLERLHRLCLVALMGALIASGALVHVAIGPIPVTFQDAFVTLSGLVLGPVHSLYAVGLYVLAGIAGFPVFSGGKAGLGHVFGPTGGYIAGFFLLAFWAGVGRRAAERFLNMGKAMTVAQFVVIVVCVLIGRFFGYALGLLWLMHSLDLSFSEAFAVGVVPFLIPGPVKMFCVILFWKYLRLYAPQCP